MDHLLFRPLTPEDLPWLIRCRDAAAHPFTALSPVSLISWADCYGFTVAGEEDFFVIHSRYDKGYYAPVGNPEKGRAFMEEAARRDPSVRFLYLTEKEASAFAERGWDVFWRAETSEYILSTARTALEDGARASQNFRRRCHQFVRKYGSYTVSPVTGDMIGRLRDISGSFLAAHGGELSDQAVVETELSHFDALGISGILLTFPDGRQAFMLGYENTPDCFTLTMVRYDSTLPEETTAICMHEFAARLLGQYPYLNVEEDLGMEGLRKAKMLLLPVDLLKTYEVRP